MSNAMTLFGNTSTNLSAMLSGFEDSLTGMLAGGGGGLRRLSIKGGVFREIVGGKEVRTSDERVMNVVFINAAPVSRNYYNSPYVVNVCCSRNPISQYFPHQYIAVVNPKQQFIGILCHRID